MAVTPLRQQAPSNDTPVVSDAENSPPLVNKSRPVRGRSTIEFPYADLDDAVSIARTIRDKGGVPLAKDQLAAAVGQPVTSGAFSAKLHAARMFGLVEFVLSKTKLTDLGFEVVEGDSNRVKAAMVKAFLNVPLFARAYNEFRNRQLPPRPTGLEQAFIGFGVLETRGVNARWAFDRSARQAGFFDNGDNRLVHPILTVTEPSSQNRLVETEPEVQTDSETATKALSVGAEDFLIRGLLARMPEPKSRWSLIDRARWLRALAVNLAVIYGENDETEIEVTVPIPANSISKEMTRPVILKESLDKNEGAPTKPAPVHEAASLTKVTSNRVSFKGADLDDEIPF